MLRTLRRAFAAALLLVGTAVMAQDSGIAQLERFMARATSAEGRFEQVVAAASGSRPEYSMGNFVFQRPGKFRWEYEKPYPQLLVSDGAKLWSWDPDLNQVTVQPMGDALGATPAAILAGDGSLEKNFRLVAEGEQGGLAWVRAEPLASDGPFAEVRIGLSDNMLRRMAMQDHFGQTTVIDFIELRVGTKPPAERFRFTPPPGADVLGN
ncbi:MAG: outer membrane lipoprotein chaperone LolA [Zoogloeaceae bacterium]|nr:outer membrane lipoprotein chaperone LolA [Zoogloeaceae bacterium]